VAPLDVRLRPFRDDDLPVLFTQQLDPEATAMAGFPSRDEEGFRAHWARLIADPTMLTAVVEVDGAVAGSLGSWLEDGRRYVGYWFGREFWGRGIATAALAAYLDELGERPLYAFVATHNTGSIRVLEKCGFALVSRDPEERLYELR
jgi:RimJ/RimL family protein N-acetyltransferase